ncbi:MAG: pilus assembly protein TadG-related protein [Chloroflexota bacterium]
MIISNKQQKGQALVLIALGIVALVAITALAIDGGNAFSERRQAQNAADTAALAGALELIQDFLGDDGDGMNWHAAASNLALSNGYDSTDPNLIVTINNPPQADCKGETSSPYFGNIQYVQVMIEQDVDTFFATVVGITQTHSCVEAIAHAKPTQSPFNGAAVVAMDCHAKWAISASGASAITVLGGGLFSNSDHEQPIYIQKPENLVLQSGYKANMVGDGVHLCNSALPAGYPYTCNLPQQTPCPPLPVDHPLLPQYECDYTITGDFKPADGTVLSPGVYCLEGRFQEANFEGDGVAFVLLNFGIAWSGNDSIRLTAPVSGPMKNTLFYLIPSNDKAVNINGTALMDLTGTILAPSSEITLNGTVDGQAFNSSVIGRTVKLTGAGVFEISYDASTSLQSPPQIELTK